MELKSNGIIGQSASLAGVFKILGKVAPTDSTVLVTGESGTGKELLVRALHAASPRADILFRFNKFRYPLDPPEHRKMNSRVRQHKYRTLRFT